MSPLDIPPHSPAASRLAVTSLALIAGFALVSGYLHQVADLAPPPRVAAAAAGTDSIAEATPAPEPMLQVAEPPPRRAHVAAAEPVDLSDEIAPAESAPAADASAVAPDPAPPEPAAPSDPPTV
jgi:hypothetical protein